MRRYHYKVYFPDNVKEMCCEFFNQLNHVNVTYHAAYQMCDDPRSIIDLPTKSDLTNESSKVVEFYENLDDCGKPTGMVQKMLVRVPHLNERFDYTYLVAREGYIVSAWCLDKSDVPRLTRSLYEYHCPENLKESVYNKFGRAVKSTEAAKEIVCSV